MSSGMTFDPRAALTRRTIAGKSVVSFESHHYALLPWGEWRRELGRPLRLLTLDAHTDTEDAFHRYACEAGKSEPWGRPISYEQDRVARIARLSADDASSVEAAIQDLHHDEHIDAAIRSGILDAAFILAHGTSGVSEEFPLDRMVLLDDRKLQSGGDAERQLRDEIIEAVSLQERLGQASKICRAAGESDPLDLPFILDIDLDAFNTRQAIAPQDPSVFYELIRRAYAISIAQEPGCVEACQIEGERLAAPWLEKQLMAHIERALS